MRRADGRAEDVEAEPGTGRLELPTGRYSRAVGEGAVILDCPLERRAREQRANGLPGAQCEARSLRF